MQLEYRALRSLHGRHFKDWWEARWGPKEQAMEPAEADLTIARFLLELHQDEITNPAVKALADVPLEKILLGRR